MEIRFVIIDVIYLFQIVLYRENMGGNICGFCHTGEENENICGPVYKDISDGKSICAHHKCMVKNGYI